MKNRKSLAAIIVAFVLVAVFAAPVFAANYDLPKDGYTMEQNGQMPQWVTVGTDKGEIGVPVEIFSASTALVLEMPEPESLRMICMGSGNGWDWGGGERDSLQQYWADGKLTLNWKTLGIDAATLHGEENVGVKILIGEWGVDWADQGVTKAYLVYSEPGSGNTSSGGDKENPKTGDNTIFAITGILALAAGATVFVARKVKAQ